MKQARPQHIFKYHCMQHLTCRAAIRPFPVSNAAGDGRRQTCAQARSLRQACSDAGCSHLLEYMAFKTTANRTYFRLTREVHLLCSIAVPTIASNALLSWLKGTMRPVAAYRRIRLWHVNPGLP